MLWRRSFQKLSTVLFLFRTNIWYEYLFRLNCYPAGCRIVVGSPRYSSHSKSMFMDCSRVKREIVLSVYVHKPSSTKSGQILWRFIWTIISQCPWDRQDCASHLVLLQVVFLRILMAQKSLNWLFCHLLWMFVIFETSSGSLFVALPLCLVWVNKSDNKLL